MTPATWPRPEPREDRLLRIDPAAGTWRDARLGDLPAELCAGDLLVVNDAATLPASLRGRGPEGQDLELRLAGLAGHGEWWAVLFGAGDWRTRTEDRPAPPRLARGDRIAIGPDLNALVRRVDASSSRLVALAFDRAGATLWAALYRHGRPVQYSHLRAPLQLWHVQTGYAARPWAVELPSAGRALTADMRRALAERGVRFASLTHAAGLSSTGDPAVRAMEGQAARHQGRLVAGGGVTDLVLDAAYRPRVTDGLLTGLHEPGTSHSELLQAFAPPELLRAAHAHAEAAGYLAHEFGDSSLVLRG